MSKLNRLEILVGNIFATILILLIIYSFAYTIFSLLFWNGQSVALYGTRGEFYMGD